MKVKYFFILLATVLMLVSFSQIFSIPPYAADIFSIYKSGYFIELEREFNILKDSFIDIKSMARPVYGWIFLDDMEKEYNIKIKVYDYKGYLIKAPGEKSNSTDGQIVKVMNSLKPGIHSEIKGDRYYSIIPVYFSGKCGFCHKDWNRRKVIGALSFERKYNSYIYYSSERIIIFIILTVFLGGILYLLIRWDPEKSIKELFDKS